MKGERSKELPNRINKDSGFGILLRGSLLVNFRVN